MTTNLRISLTILSLGLALEGVAELYTWLTPGADHATLSLLFLLPTLLTLLGLVFVWVGRHEWTELHHTRARRAGTVFGLSLLGGFVAVAEVAVLVAYPAMGTPWWSEVLFGAAIASLIFGTFVTYAYLVFHLVGLPSKAAIAGGLAWALVVSVLITFTLASDLPQTLTLLRDRSLTLPSFFGPVEALLSYLFLSYFLILAAYLEAHVVVARGLPSRGRTVPGRARPGP